MPDTDCVTLHMPTRESELVHCNVAWRENDGLYGPHCGNTGSVLFGLLFADPKYDSLFHKSLSLFIEPE